MHPIGAQAIWEQIRANFEYVLEIDSFISISQSNPNQMADI